MRLDYDTLKTLYAHLQPKTLAAMAIDINKLSGEMREVLGGSLNAHMGGPDRTLEEWEQYYGEVQKLKERHPA